ncbi:50S ribosomal protein L9 [Patescibacteria group bacterium]|nr:50S ribosomal protein L9 [Patescibacteria group bacterium]MBU4162189.1 50S ribosomal protein L9 [Patescibacteria group bacterium]
MKVILLKDIENLGKKYEVKSIKNGYARNFLIPNGLAKLATSSAITELKEIKKKEELLAEKHLIETQEIASKFDGQGIEFFVKTGEDGQLFESITPLKISKKLCEMGFEIKKDQIILEKPIKELGEFPVKIMLDHHLEAKITLIVEPESPREPSEE